MDNGEKNLILIDGHALAFRSFFALERTGMKTGDNTPVWAVYGFFKAIFDLLTNKNIEPNCIAVAFDVGRKTFRAEKFEEYKANRETMPDALRIQIGLIIEGLRAFNIPIFTKEGFEADDVIGTIARKSKEQRDKVLILTGDKDAFQLVDKCGFVKVLIPTKGELVEYNWEKVYEKMYVYPDQIVDFKALSGDSSDNIPGIKGIGPKTASVLLQQYKNLDNIYKNLEEISKRSLREKLENGRSQAYLSRFLAKIDQNVDLNFDIKCASLEIPDVSEVLSYLKKMQFYGFIKNINSILAPFNVQALQNYSVEKEKDSKIRFDSDKKTNSMQLGFNFNIEENAKGFEVKTTNLYSKILVDSKEKLKKFVKILDKCDKFAIDVINIAPFKSKPLCLMFALENDSCVSKKTKVYFIPLNLDNFNNLDIKYVINSIEKILLNEKIEKYSSDSKNVLNTLRCENEELKVTKFNFDVTIASYVKDVNRRHSIESQANEHLDFIFKVSDRVEKLSPEQLYEYGCDVVFSSLELVKFWKRNLTKKELEIFNKFEMPLVYVLSEMEYNGVSIDLRYLKDLSIVVDNLLRDIEDEIFEESGERFNINSPKKVSEVLFEKLGLKTKVKKKTQNGFSTNASVLEQLALENKIAKDILSQRHLSKLKSTYIDNLPKLLSSYDNRIHTNFNQTITTTGRLSSSDPNLQNIPTRTDLGNKIRGAFVPCNKSRYKILSCDYSQIELRLLAHISGDKTLIDSFQRDIDIHTLTASKVFNIGIDDVTKDMRRKAKAVNFGIIYGQTKYGLAKSLNISIYEANDFINKYFNTYPKIQEYIQKTIEFVLENGYVETIYGRRRDLSQQINSSTKRIKEFAIRAAINAPLQGSAADLIKLAMIDLFKKLDANKLESKLIMQVHDELILEVKNEETEFVKGLTVESMELGQPFKVPLKVDTNVSESWMEG